jgi:hypothetical protein
MSYFGMSVDDFISDRPRPSPSARGDRARLAVKATPDANLNFIPPARFAEARRLASWAIGGTIVGALIGACVELAFVGAAAFY